MITPKEIEKKAASIYKRFLKMWAREGAPAEFFPVRIPANLNPIKDDFNAAATAVESLKSKSKHVRGWGYRLELEERRDRTLGRNRYPKAIYLDTLDDLLSLTGKRVEFAATQAVFRTTVASFPGLHTWACASVGSLHQHVDYIDDLIRVAAFFLDNPRPDCYARQIPVNVDTKFIERHQRILHQWLDELLPPDAIDVNESRFARRFGLRDAEQHRGIRVLDQSLQQELGFPFDEVSLPTWELRKLPVVNAKVFVVENRLNLLTLPSVLRALAIRGEGKAVTRLEKLPWLESLEIYYWGDIDVDGFLILSSLRNLFPQTKSIFMDVQTFEAHKEFQVAGNGNSASLPSNLTPAESRAFSVCSVNNLRLEQEKVLQSYVNGFVATNFSAYRLEQR